ncbi:hypothetical protein L6164_026987 [Bauhinia variegata]|uniref:Uncharacterized protein n=1 Tax=Bauhinia variegata TaxID=167791 RepID=A0ACB9LTB7_BAUVA|nr:hypothetical protein L6164_026987 [Bauhinia variegata]
MRTASNLLLGPTEGVNKATSSWEERSHWPPTGGFRRFYNRSFRSRIAEKKNSLLLLAKSLFSNLLEAYLDFLFWPFGHGGPSF